MFFEEVMQNTSVCYHEEFLLKTQLLKIRIKLVTLVE